MKKKLTDRELVAALGGVNEVAEFCNFAYTSAVRNWFIAGKMPWFRREQLEAELLKRKSK